MNRENHFNIDSNIPIMGKGGCIDPALLTASSEESCKIANDNKKKRQITPSMLATKNTLDECWIAYEGGVYDVTHWLRKHPGGIRSIMSTAGSDASSVMKSLHTPNTLEKYIKRIRRVGDYVQEPEMDTLKNSLNANKSSIEDSKGKEAQDKKMRARERNKAIHEEFGQLNEKLIREGWYEANSLDYFFPIARVLAMLFCGVTLTLWTQTDVALANYSPLVRTLALLAGSTIVGLFFQNTAFMGHDAGHSSVTNSYFKDYVFGHIVGNLLSGIDIGWWKSTHFVHHCATNSLHDDPDIQHMPFLCFEERMAENRWSTYHSKYMPLDDIAKAMIPYQHYIFYPAMGVARVNLYLQGIIYLLKTHPFANDHGKAGQKILDEQTGQVKEAYAWPKQSIAKWLFSVLTLAAFWTGMYRFYSSMDMTSAIVSFFVTHFVAGLLHVQILFSHTAMEYCTDGHGTEGAIHAPNGNGEAGYYEWQALSTMDIDCSPHMDWFHGGLQFQLEHHLFPRVPRYRLRELRELTDAIFAKYDVPVVRIPFVEGNYRMLMHLKRVGEKVAKTHIHQKFL